MTQYTLGNVVDLDTARGHHQRAARLRTRAALWATAADVPILIAEIDRLRSLLALSRVYSANLLAAARATLAAERDGEQEPLFYLRDELDNLGQLPPKDMSPSELLAVAKTIRDVP
jgi:hypothetical protein